MTLGCLSLQCHVSVLACTQMLTTLFFVKFAEATALLLLPVPDDLLDGLALEVAVDLRGVTKPFFVGV